jgi:hypothetical protein
MAKDLSNRESVQTQVEEGRRVGDFWKGQSKIVGDFRALPESRSVHEVIDEILATRIVGHDEVDLSLGYDQGSEWDSLPCLTSINLQFVSLDNFKFIQEGNTL